MRCRRVAQDQSPSGRTNCKPTKGNLFWVTGVRCGPLRGVLPWEVMSPKLPHHRREMHPASMKTTARVYRSKLGKRRSARMALNASVGLSGEDRQKTAFTMPARASNLNRHGASVQLNRDLLVGSTVTVKNQRGTTVPARVVAQIAAVQGVSTYAIEFVEQEDSARDFWGITFPPSA